MALSTFEFYAVTLFLAIATYLLIKKIIYLRRLPPGPWGLPLIGSLIQLNRKNCIHEFIEYKKKYGKIFSVGCGDFTIVVLSDYKIIADALKRDEFLGRPDFQSWELRNQGKKNRGILFADGDESWSEQRRFALRNLRDFGFGKRSMEELLLFELQDLLKLLNGLIGKPIEVRTMFNASVFNSLWCMLTGSRFELDDPNFTNLVTMTSNHLSKAYITGVGSYYPWPAKYNLVRRGLWEKTRIMWKHLFSLMDNVIQEHLDTFDESYSRDFVDVFLQQIKKSERHSSFYSDEGRQSLRVVLLDLFSAGTETTSTTILWSILYMTKHKEMQKKLQDEVDTIIGKDRQPSRDDRPKMIYFEAFCNEVHRKASLLPMSVYHKMMKDTEYHGYLLPKNAVVFPNLYDAHHDPEYWGDPEVFRPQRFLDETGTKLIKHEPLMPFSIGKRSCLGETLARDNLFLFLTGLIQNFSFDLDPSCADMDIDIIKPNFVVAPDPFKVILTSRAK